MKKISIFIMVLLLALAMVGCSEKTTKKFEISGASKITVFSGSTGEYVEVTDETDIKHITDNINALSFSRDKSSKEQNGFSYSLTWYDSDNEPIDGLIIMSEYQISYDDYFYNGMEADNEIDIEFIEGLFDGE